MKSNERAIIQKYQNISLSNVLIVVYALLLLLVQIKEKEA